MQGRKCVIKMPFTKKAGPNKQTDKQLFPIKLNVANFVCMNPKWRFRVAFFGCHYLLYLVIAIVWETCVLKVRERKVVCLWCWKLLSLACSETENRIANDIYSVAVQFFANFDVNQRYKQLTVSCWVNKLGCKQIWLKFAPTFFGKISKQIKRPNSNKQNAKRMHFSCG